MIMVMKLASIPLAYQRHTHKTRDREKERKKYIRTKRKTNKECKRGRTKIEESVYREVLLPLLFSPPPHSHKQDHWKVLVKVDLCVK